MIAYPHVNEQHPPPHHSRNSHTVQPEHPPGPSAHYWMPAKQVSNHSGVETFTVGDGGMQRQITTQCYIRNTQMDFGK